MPAPTVTVFDRNLADAGLRSKGGRGRSAAKMVPSDAANLLIAVAGSSMVKDAAQTVRDYASLPSKDRDMGFGHNFAEGEPDGRAETCWWLPGFPIAALQELPETHTFHDALTALIAAAKDGSLQDTIRNLPAEDEHFRIRNMWRIEVMLWGPYPQASIRVYASGFSEKHQYSLIPKGTEAVLQWAKEMESYDTGDLRNMHEFSAASILALGDLLNH